MFQYFHDPHNFSTYTLEPQQCEICGEHRPGYGGSFYGPEDLDFVCEDCLANGKLSERNFTTNIGSYIYLREQLAKRRPDLSLPEIEALSLERTAEIEQRTPHLVTWQDMSWPAHCGEYCCFMKDAGRADFKKLSHADEARTFFESHLFEADKDTDLSDLWESVCEDSPKNN